MLLGRKLGHLGRCANTDQCKFAQCNVFFLQTRVLVLSRGFFGVTRSFLTKALKFSVTIWCDSLANKT